MAVAYTKTISRDEIYGSTLNLVGVNHRTLHIAEREKLAQAGVDGAALIKSVVQECGLAEAAILSTCNRFEIISVGEDAAQRIKDYLGSMVDRAQIETSAYALRNADAVRHFFRVAASLDSMVVGEPQIAGQVKEAYQTAVQAGCAGRYLHNLFQFGFHLAKSVRLNTGVAEKGVSVSYVAVKLAQQIFGDLSQRCALIVGGGKMAELALLHLKSYGCTSVIVANRSVEKAALMARQMEGLAISLADIETVLAKVDVLIGSISVDKPLLDARTVRKHKGSAPLFLIDLGVPRNFSPALSEMEGVYLYNVDDLAHVAEENKVLREEAAKDAEVVIEYGVCQFERWLKKLSVEPLVLNMREKIHAICRSELERSLQVIIEKEAVKEVVPELSHRVSQKIAHEVTALIEGAAGQKLDYDVVVARVLKEIFEI